MVFNRCVFVLIPIFQYCIKSGFCFLRLFVDLYTANFLIQKSAAWRVQETCSCDSKTTFLVIVENYPSLSLILIIKFLSFKWNKNPQAMYLILTLNNAVQWKYYKHWSVQHYSHIVWSKDCFPTHSFNHKQFSVAYLNVCCRMLSKLCNLLNLL